MGAYGDLGEYLVRLDVPISRQHDAVGGSVEVEGLRGGVVGYLAGVVDLRVDHVIVHAHEAVGCGVNTGQKQALFQRLEYGRDAAPG